MADKTSNYNLIKPANNETADIDVLNGNFDIIDTKIKENHDHINDAVEDIGDKANLSTNNKDNIVNAVNEISTSMADIANDVANTNNRLEVNVNVNITSTNWVDDTGNSGYWYYDIVDIKVNNNTIVNFAVHLADIDKAKKLKNITRSFEGYYRFYAKEKPSENFLMDVTKLNEVNI